MKLKEIQYHPLTCQISAVHCSSWSEDNSLAALTRNGILVVGSRRLFPIVILLWSLISLSSVGANDITYSVFGKYHPGIPAAFGDFNSDELTDLFTIKFDSKSPGSSLEILLGSDSEPLLRRVESLVCSFKKFRITSVVPGDFDSDAKMDVLVTATNSSKGDGFTYVFVHWGNLESLECASEDNPWIIMKNQPLAMDYNKDMIMDLFGLDEDNKRSFWLFNKNKTKPSKIPLNNKSNSTSVFRTPHSNAFIDLNSDGDADLYITTETEAEFWFRDGEGFKKNRTVKFDINKHDVIGQTTFIDMHLTGELLQLIPSCTKDSTGCIDSDIFVLQSFNSTLSWQPLSISFIDPNNKKWTFAYSKSDELFLNAITLRAGDFNMDGFPDLLATLSPENDKSIKQTFLLENQNCVDCNTFHRKFLICWDALSSNNNNTALGVFYDFFQDGVLDVIFVQQNPSSKVTAFRNSLDYDANFLKAMVISSVPQNYEARPEGPLGKKYSIFGTNLPGPTIAYLTQTPEGHTQKACSAQLPQSAYFSLILPYTIFGLGRAPNYIDNFTVYFFGESRSWLQLIPNSQIIVIPYPLNAPDSWRTQLFVTPSKIILRSVFALLGTCLLITAIITVLYWKERKEDKKEKLQQSQRFHFDAM